MPDKGIKPPNKRVVELIEEVKSDVFSRFENVKSDVISSDKCITYLTNELANARAIIEFYEAEKDK